MTKTFRKYEAILLAKRPLTKSEILGLAWALNGAKRVNLLYPHRVVLTALINRRAERPIAKELSTFGVQWLRKKAFKLNGEPRQGKTQPFGDRELKIIKGFSKYRWVGFHNTQEDYGNFNGCKSLTPIWRCYDRKGNYFDYYVRGGFREAEVVII